jgi:hypothetical protein
MKISADELRQATLFLLKHLQETNQTEFEIGEDFYWNVPANARYDSYTEPKELTVGQLSDDWAEVKRSVQGERDPMGSDLIALSSILRRVGEKTLG